MFEKPRFKWIEPKEIARRRDLAVEKRLPKWVKPASISVAVLILLVWWKFKVNLHGVDSPPLATLLLGALLFSIFAIYLLPTMMQGRPSKIELTTNGSIRIIAGSIKIVEWQDVCSFSIRDYEIFSVLSLQKRKTGEKIEFIVPEEIVISELEAFLNDSGLIKE